MKRILLGLAAAVFLLASWRLARACAPNFLRAVFSYSRHPDLPQTGFIDGRLGVLAPTFARSYLVIAYRYLNGIGLNPREREQARDYYKDRLTGSWDSLGEDWPERWRAARSAIKLPPAPQALLVTNGQLAYNPETHSFALNCAEDAFRVALHTMQARRARFGAASAAFRNWLGAQDTVFQNCQRGSARIPPGAAPGLPPIIRADREYQIAAAYFYASEYPAALDRFGRISQDPASPWNALAHYLVVRTLLRMTDDPGAALQAGERLNSEAQSILADPKLSSVHGMTWNLMTRADIRARDQVYFRDLARLLASRGQDDGFREELWNYTDMYDGVIGDADPNAVYRFGKIGALDVARFQDADLSDWLFHFQAKEDSVFSYCLARWRRTRSMAWLLAALSHAHGAQAGQFGLADAATMVPESSPAYLTVRFHLIRLQEELDDKAGARREANAVLSGMLLENLPSSTNLFRGLRMLAAPDLRDFAQFALRRPVMVTFQANAGETPDSFPDPEAATRKSSDLFDADATLLLNSRTPFRLLKQAALETSLPDTVRREALMTAFARGLMLDEDLTEIAGRLSDIDAELAPLAAGYLAETTAEGRRFAGAFLLLHRPEARPYFATGITRQSPAGELDDYRDNWWCPMDVVAAMDSRANINSLDWFEIPPNRLQQSADVTPEFLEGSAATETKAELGKLGRLGAAANFLGSIVFQFAALHPEDRRVPEALYWLVRAGHYSCVDANTWKTTRQAFRMLHLNYPKTAWAARTPTWFKNADDIHQEMKRREQAN